MQAAAGNQNQKENTSSSHLQTTQFFGSPKGAAKQSNCLRAATTAAGAPNASSQQQQQRHQSGSPGAFATTNTNKTSKQHHSSKHQHQTRLTVEKFLKKRVGEQLAIFARAGVTAVGFNSGNQHFAIPSAKVGEVFSSIAKAANSRAESNVEIVHLLKATTSVATSGGKGTANTSKKKKQAQLSQQQSTSTAAKQILSSMGLHHQLSQSAAPQQQPSNSNQNSNSAAITHSAIGASGLPPHSTTWHYQQTNKTTSSHNMPLGNFSTAVRLQSGKKGSGNHHHQGSTTANAGKNQRRSSQSRLENFELGFFSKKAYRLPIHKLKKRLKQHLVNHSIQSVQESLFNQQVRESCAAAMRQGRTSKRAPKDNHHQHNSNNNVAAVPSQNNNRSKSKSPVKKTTTSSRVSNKPRPQTKRSSNNNHRAGKKTTNGLMMIEEQQHQLQQHPLGRTLARRTEEFNNNAFSSLDTSNLLEYADISKNTSNLNQRTVTVNDEIKQNEKILALREEDQSNQNNRPHQSSNKYEEQEKQLVNAIQKISISSADAQEQHFDQDAIEGDIDGEEQSCGSADASEEDEEDDQSVVPDEVLLVDPLMDAANVIRELSKLCALQHVAQQHGLSLNDANLMSRQSHRSHDNLGYVASPLTMVADADPDGGLTGLIETASSKSRSGKEGGRSGCGHSAATPDERRAYSARAAAIYLPNDRHDEDEGEEAEADTSDDGGEFEEEDLMDDSVDEGIRSEHGAAMFVVGQTEDKLSEQVEQVMASPVSDLIIPSEERRLLALNSRKQLTVPALKANALAHLGNLKAIEQSGNAQLQQVRQPQQRYTKQPTTTYNNNNKKVPPSNIKSRSRSKKKQQQKAAQLHQNQPQPKKHNQRRFLQDLRSSKSSSRHKQIHSQIKNRDVTEWLVEDLQGAEQVVVDVHDEEDADNDFVQVDQQLLYLQQQHRDQQIISDGTESAEAAEAVIIHNGTHQQMQKQLGARFTVAQALSKPKSPSNLSMASQEDQDTPVAELAVPAAPAGQEDESACAV